MVDREAPPAPKRSSSLLWNRRDAGLVQSITANPESGFSSRSAHLQNKEATFPTHLQAGTKLSTHCAFSTNHIPPSELKCVSWVRAKRKIQPCRRPVSSLDTQEAHFPDGCASYFRTNVKVMRGKEKIHKLFIHSFIQH